MCDKVIVPSSLTTAVVFVWMLNILMIFSQLAIDDMTANTGTHFLNCSGTILTAYSTSDDCSSLIGPMTGNLTSELPIGATGGIFFVDWISSATNWIGKQINSFTQVANAPYNMLMAIPTFQDPRYSIFASIISIAWWAISLLLIVAFILGR